MKTKTLFGLGLACAACCALPLPGFAGFTLGGASLATGLGVSLDFIICVAGPIALVIGLIALLWSRRRTQTCTTCSTDKSCGCA